MVFLALTLTGCAPSSSLDTGLLMTEPTGFSGFSWVIEGELAGMPEPSLAELSWAAEEGVAVLVSLTETGTDPDLAAALGVEVVHIPVPDMTAPTLHQLQKFIAVTDASLRDGRPVGVHCLAGMGRTGTFLAAWFVREGMTPAQAISHVRTLRPGSIETDEQEWVIVQFAAALP